MNSVEFKLLGLVVLELGEVKARRSLLLFSLR